MQNLSAFCTGLLLTVRHVLCCAVLLLSVSADFVTESTVEGGRKLLCFAGNCVRPLSTVQQHKVSKYRGPVLVAHH